VGINFRPLESAPLSVNSDEIPIGILKAVAVLVGIAGFFYCLFNIPWLLLLLILAALVWGAWRALINALAKWEPRALRTIGYLLMAVAPLTLLGVLPPQVNSELAIRIMLVGFLCFSSALGWWSQPIEGRGPNTTTHGCTT
jgi:hypothetical protein